MILADWKYLIDIEDIVILQSTVSADQNFVFVDKLFMSSTFNLYALFDHNYI